MLRGKHGIKKPPWDGDGGPNKKEDAK